MNKYFFFILVLIINSFNMNAQYYFPFGQKLNNVVQIDTTPKKVFVLGVYASAVHAKWIDSNGKVLIKALAVASEPYIFWNGDSIEALKIINEISVPKEFGKLLPADSIYNGPSGRCLDENFLHPLGYQRKNTWLCDLIPYSCQNPNQKDALEREYNKYSKTGKLPQYNIPEVPKKLVDENRIQGILQELKLSQAEIIILLGDQPIKYFLSKYSKHDKLSDFEEYGKPIEIFIEDKIYKVIALAHPRQVSKLGKANHKWYQKHKIWTENQLKDL